MVFGNRLLTIMIVFLLGLSHFAANAYGFFWEPDVTKEQLDGICEARGGLRNAEPIYVDGYYGGSARHWLSGVGAIYSKLGNNRFRYYELDADAVFGHSWGNFET